MRISMLRFPGIDNIYTLRSHRGKATYIITKTLKSRFEGLASGNM